MSEDQTDNATPTAAASLQVLPPAAEAPAVLDDERMDMPSASKWSDFVIECPGMFPLLRTSKEALRTTPKASTPAAERGTRIHKARETGSTAGLADETEVKAYNTGCKQEVASLDKWREDFSITEFSEQALELRLWLNDPESFQPLASARFDVHYVGTTIAPDDGVTRRVVLLHDWKTGDASYDYCPPAKDNWQMRVGAVLAMEEYDADFVRVELNRMEHRTPQVDRHDYTKAELLAWKERMLADLRAIGPLSPRRPGDCCTFCPCATVCPERVSLSLLPTVRAGLDLDNVPKRISPEMKEAIRQRVSSLTPEDLAYIHRRAGLIGTTLELVKAQLKTLPEADLSSLGFKLGDGRPMYAVPPGFTHKAIEKLVDLGVPEADAWTLLKVDLTAAAKYFQTAKSMTEDMSKEYVRSKLEDFIKKEVGEKILRGI